jgi:hypothetical protein
MTNASTAIPRRLRVEDREGGEINPMGELGATFLLSVGGIFTSLGFVFFLSGLAISSVLYLLLHRIRFLWIIYVSLIALAAGIPLAFWLYVTIFPLPGGSIMGPRLFLMLVAGPTGWGWVLGWPLGMLLRLIFFPSTIKSGS